MKTAQQGHRTVTSPPFKIGSPVRLIRVTADDRELGFRRGDVGIVCEPRAHGSDPDSKIAAVVFPGYVGVDGTSAMVFDWDSLASCALEAFLRCRGARGVLWGADDTDAEGRRDDPRPVPPRIPRFVKGLRVYDGGRSRSALTPERG